LGPHFARKHFSELAARGNRRGPCSRDRCRSAHRTLSPSLHCLRHPRDRADPHGDITADCVARRSALSVSTIAPSRLTASSIRTNYHSWQPDREGRPTAGFAVDCDVAAHHARKLARDRKAEPRSAVAARGQVIGLGEILLGRHANARIHNRKLDPITSARHYANTAVRVPPRPRYPHGGRNLRSRRAASRRRQQILASRWMASGPAPSSLQPRQALK